MPVTGSSKRSSEASSIASWTACARWAPCSRTRCPARPTTSTSWPTRRAHEPKIPFHRPLGRAPRGARQGGRLLGAARRRTVVQREQVEQLLVEQLLAQQRLVL